jgi:hypothetical protein
MKVWYGSGSADPDADRDESGSCYFVSDLPDVNKIFFYFLNYFAYYFSKVHLHHFSKIKVIKISQNSMNQCFLLFLLDDRRIRIRISD